ncbi:hypothetical protein N7454_007028 [Penicillium verhagenii]|nr:hypothetical protein N7454_007028 [Penicillium verhagenii]
MGRAGNPRATDPKGLQEQQLQELLFLFSGTLNNENTVANHRKTINEEGNRAKHCTVRDTQIMANEQGETFFKSHLELIDNMTQCKQDWEKKFEESNKT